MFVHKMDLLIYVYLYLIINQHDKELSLIYLHFFPRNGLRNCDHLFLYTFIYTRFKIFLHLKIYLNITFHKRCRCLIQRVLSYRLNNIDSLYLIKHRFVYHLYLSNTYVLLFIKTYYFLSQQHIPYLLNMLNV